MKAFSIIEFLFVLGVFAILLLIGGFAGDQLLSKNRTAAAVDTLRTAIKFTRIAAVKLGEDVRFCGSKDHIHCDGLWQEGQIVITTSGVIQRVLPKISPGDRLIWKSLGKKPDISFSPTGFSNGQKGSFHYCPKNNKEKAVAIILEFSGRIRVSEKTEDGEKISCS